MQRASTLRSRAALWLGAAAMLALGVYWLFPRASELGSVPLVRAEPGRLTRLRPLPLASTAHHDPAPAPFDLTERCALDSATLEGARLANAELSAWAAASGNSLVVELDGQACLRWSLPLGGPESSRVRVTLAPSAEISVHARLARGGQPIVGSEHAVRVPAATRGSARVVVELEIPAASTLDEPLDALELVLGGAPGTSVALHALTFEGRRLEGWFARSSDAELPRVEVTGEARPAFGIATGEPLWARLAVDTPCDLVVAWSVQAASTRPAAECELVLTWRVSGGSGAKAADGSIAARAELGSWSELRVALDEFVGRELEIGFELRGARGVPRVFAHLAEPWIVPRGARQPSVLLITSDTHRADHAQLFSARGAPLMPELDAFARTALAFDDCLASTNVTIPSHAALFTGLSPRDTRLFDNFSRLSAGADTLAEAFAGAGWHTLAAVSARHLAPDSSGLGAGFDRYALPLANEQRVDAALEAAEALLAGSEAVPVFLWVHLFDGHVPYEPAPEFELVHRTNQGDPFDVNLPEPRLPPEFIAFMPPGLRDLDLQRARYAGELSALDAQLPRLFAHPRLAEGVIAFTADHGESLGEHQVFWEHEGLYPQTTRVPLVLRWPGGRAGDRNARPVSSSDLGRTLLDLAGLASEPFVGHSLLDDAAPAAARCLISANALTAAIYDQGWCLVLALRAAPVWIDGPCHEARVAHSCELYDLARDPACEHDLTSLEPERTRRLRAELSRWLARAAELPLSEPATLAPAQVDALATLGYTATLLARRPSWIPSDCDCRACSRWRE